MKKAIGIDSKENEIVKYLAGELTLEEEKGLKLWISKSSNEKLLEGFEDTWSQFDDETLFDNVKEKNNAYRKLHSKLSTREVDKKHSYYPLLQIAAIFIAVLSCTFLLYNFFNSHSFISAPVAVKTLRVKNGNKSQFKLPDKSKIFVNSGSTLVYAEEFNNVRTVSLTGEAFINVVPNPDKPFIVDCGDYKVKVLGTSFNVKSYPDDENFSVVVSEGLVEVSYLNNVIGLIKPGYSINVNTTNQEYEVQKVKAEEVTEWKSNRLYFKNTSFPEIKNTLERWYDVKITVKNDKINKCSFAGSFENRSIDYVLSIISQVGNFKYTVDYDKKEIIVTGNGCEK